MFKALFNTETRSIWKMFVCLCISVEVWMSTYSSVQKEKSYVNNLTAKPNIFQTFLVYTWNAENVIIFNICTQGNWFFLFQPFSMYTSLTLCFCLGTIPAVSYAIQHIITAPAISTMRRLWRWGMIISPQQRAEFWIGDSATSVYTILHNINGFSPL